MNADNEQKHIVEAYSYRDWTQTLQDKAREIHSGIEANLRGYTSLALYAVLIETCKEGPHSELRDRILGHISTKITKKGDQEYTAIQEQIEYEQGILDRIALRAGDTYTHPREQKANAVAQEVAKDLIDRQQRRQNRTTAQPLAGLLNRMRKDNPDATSPGESALLQDDDHLLSTLNRLQQQQPKTQREQVANAAAQQKINDMLNQRQGKIDAEPTDERLMDILLGRNGASMEQIMEEINLNRLEFWFANNVGTTTPLTFSPIPLAALGFEQAAALAAGYEAATFAIPGVPGIAGAYRFVSYVMIGGIEISLTQHKKAGGGFSTAEDVQKFVNRLQKNILTGLPVAFDYAHFLTPVIEILRSVDVDIPNKQLLKGIGMLRLFRRYLSVEEIQEIIEQYKSDKGLNRP